MGIDEIDLKILEVLIRDARLSSRQVADKVGVSVGTALARIRRMEREGIIKGYSAIVDHEKLGYQLTAVIAVSYTHLTLPTN